MRLIHVTDTFLPKIGGAEIAIDALVRAMGDAGQECAVLAQRPRGMSRAAGTEIEVPYRLERFPGARSSLWAGWWIGRYLANLGRSFGTPDAVIGHHAFPPGYAAVRYARRHGIPSIVYPRGGDIYEVSRFRKKKLAWQKLTWALSNATVVVCASTAMEQIVRQIIGAAASRGRIVRIPNGVNLDDIRADSTQSRFATEREITAPFVLGLGRAIRRKGFHLLIEAADALPADWNLVIAGDGRELPALREQAKGSGAKVIFTGLVEGADKRWLLQHCRFMAAPSLEESFGNVALEAMACGKPVVASRASGFAEIVCDQANGWLVEVGDVASLRVALRTGVTAEGTRLAAVALETASRFRWESIAGRYLGLIDWLRRPEVLRNPQPVRGTAWESGEAAGSSG